MDLKEVGQSSILVHGRGILRNTVENSNVWDFH